MSSAVRGFGSIQINDRVRFSTLRDGVQVGTVVGKRYDADVADPFQVWLTVRCDGIDFLERERDVTRL